MENFSFRSFKNKYREVEKMRSLEEKKWYDGLRGRIIPILPLGPTKSLLKIFSRDYKEIRKGIGKASGMEILYSFPERVRKKEVSLYDMFWQRFLALPRAVRNRLALVENFLVSKLRRKPDLWILSLGGGSGREFFDLGDILMKSKSRVVVVDKDVNILERIEERAKKELPGVILVWSGKIEEFLELNQGKEDKFDIVEMIGVSEYLSNSKLLKLFKKIKNVLKEEGIFLIDVMQRNKESDFLSKVIGWELTYRSEKEMEILLRNSEFKIREKIREPFSIFTILVSERD